MARCRFNEAQLSGTGSRVATEREIAALQDFATPFHSLDENKETAARRLHLQHDSDKKAQESVAPYATAAGSSDVPTMKAPSTRASFKRSADIVSSTEDMCNGAYPKASTFYCPF